MICNEVSSDGLSASSTKLDRASLARCMEQMPISTLNLILAHPISTCFDRMMQNSMNNSDRMGVG